MATLFTTQTPTATITESPGPTLGQVIIVAVAGVVDQLGVYGSNPLPDNASTYPLVLYDATTQVELARAVKGSMVSDVWNWVTLSTPVAVTAGQRLIAAWKTDNKYAYVANLFQSAGLTNGNLSAPATGADPIGNGRFATGVDAYPTGTFGGHCYLVDINFTPTGSGAAPNGLAVPVALGTPTVSLGLTASPSGLSVPVALGQPTVSLNRSTAPTGLSVAVGLGTPTVGPTQAVLPSVTPNGLSIPVALGQPAVGPTVLTPTPGVRVGGGWGSLSSVLRSNAALAAEQLRETPTACPNDGEPLRTGPRGELYCPWDGWRYTRS